MINQTENKKFNLTEIVILSLSLMFAFILSYMTVYNITILIVCLIAMIIILTYLK